MTLKYQIITPVTEMIRVPSSYADRGCNLQSISYDILSFQTGYSLLNLYPRPAGRSTGQPLLSRPWAPMTQS
jgi:hypothetical protein